MAITARTTTFESINVGDMLPTVQKAESQEQINAHGGVMDRRSRQQPVREVKNQHTDEAYAREKGFFSGTVNYGVSTVAFMHEVLELSFPHRSIARAKVTMRAVEPIRANDLVTYSGKITGKRTEGAQRVVDVALEGTNQAGMKVAIATAVVPM